MADSTGAHRSTNGTHGRTGNVKIPPSEVSAPTQNVDPALDPHLRDLPPRLGGPSIMMFEWQNCAYPSTWKRYELKVMGFEKAREELADLLIWNDKVDEVEEMKKLFLDRAILTAMFAPWTGSRDPVILDTTSWDELVTNEDVNAIKVDCEGISSFIENSALKCVLSLSANQ